MNEREFEINGNKYQLNKITPMIQFHIVRRLGGLLGEAIPVVQSIAKTDSKDMTEEQRLESVAKIAGPLFNGFSKLSNEDSEFILHSLCGSVSIFQTSSNNWARIMSGNTFAFDTDLPTMLKLAGRAFLYNMTGFFATAQQVSHGR